MTQAEREAEEGTGEAETSPTSPGSPSPPPGLPPRGARGIPFLGRRWVPAGWLEIAFWGLGCLGCVAALALAALWLRPDRRGIGTHEQLGLPPCGFVEFSGGIPCPSCGYTTTFALAAQGHPLQAFHNQPFGFLVFLSTILAVPVTLVASLKRISLFAATEHWPWVRIFLATFALWLLAWAYKWSTMAG